MGNEIDKVELLGEFEREVRFLEDHLSNLFTDFDFSFKLYGISFEGNESLVDLATRLQDFSRSVYPELSSFYTEIIEMKLKCVQEKPEGRLVLSERVTNTCDQLEDLSLD